MRLPNHRIEAEISALKPFVNYNATITANQSSDIYAVWHWSTKIAEFNTATQKLEFLQVGYISQTTSALIGRILRALPDAAVLEFINALGDNQQRKRLMRMTRLDDLPQIY
jgi:hypothetical protein